MKLLHRGLPMALIAGMGVTGLAACSNMTGGGASQSSHSMAATAPTVAPEMVKQVQSKLRDGGYYKQGPVDGVWGSGTEAAVRSFQRDHSLGSSGQLDVPTLQALNIAGVSSATNGTAPTTTNVAPTQPMRTDSNVPPADNTVTSPTNSNATPTR